MYCLISLKLRLLGLRGLLRALSGCSIFCRPGFGLGLGRSGLFRRGLAAACRFLVLGSGILGRSSDHRVGLLLVRGRGRGFVRTCSSGLAGTSLRGFALRRSFGLCRSSLLLGLMVADCDDLQDRVLLAVALLAAIVVP